MRHLFQFCINRAGLPPPVWYGHFNCSLCYNSCSRTMSVVHILVDWLHRIEKIFFSIRMTEQTNIFDFICYLTLIAILINNSTISNSPNSHLTIFSKQQQMTKCFKLVGWLFFFRVYLNYFGRFSSDEELFFVEIGHKLICGRAHFMNHHLNSKKLIKCKIWLN